MSRTLTFADGNSDLKLVLQLTYLSQKHGGRTLKETSNGYIKPYRSEKPVISLTVGGDRATLQITFLVMRLSKMGNEDRFSGLCSICATLSEGATSQSWNFWLQLEGACSLTAAAAYSAAAHSTAAAT